MRFSLAAAAAATGATFIDAAAAPQTLRISTDTRTIGPGDTFLALRGERFDGHAFAAEAVARGASLLILERADARVEGVATMIVPDALQAFMMLGALARESFEGRVVAITGSTGKTTTKSFLVQLLAARYGDRVAAPPANENNEIGVTKLMLSLSSETHDVAVVEMGARRSGDIDALVEVARPEIGILTNVGEAHLEIMGSRARLEETKWALFSRGARAILNSRDEVSRRRAPSLSQPPDWFAAFEEIAPSAQDAALRPYAAVLGEARVLYRDGRGEVECDVPVRVPGLHNRANLAAAVAGAVRLDVPFDAIVNAIPDVELPPGRYQSMDVNGLRVIYDAYNANASGMIAALDAFAAEKGTRRIAVLASMAELGEESQDLHQRVGGHAARRVDVLLVAGDFAAALALGARDAGLDSASIVAVESNAVAARWLREHARAGDVVLLKGSRKYQLEEIVEDLRG
ncbi:MAG TPA: UDP-N-acetylmuramoyl-tripeptide--D-alanyl-D-alanine ligase [Candidatus Baltobacteraceae bacterium]|jgi:UDP-N-acetylmuramoyl-tripeptide--D-alanyl-D-alanine ligase|nr:UDP-N-acetylmuramoyl-tripeptide--D-alanyl-D-alanine ligase [Candidatus Baltobacteraceae bacterium]